MIHELTEEVKAAHRAQREELQRLYPKGIHHKQRPNDGQLIVVLSDNKWRAGYIIKRGSYDYLNTGEGPPRMITYGARWIPINEPA